MALAPTSGAQIGLQTAIPAVDAVSALYGTDQQPSRITDRRAATVHDLFALPGGVCRVQRGHPLTGTASPRKPSPFLPIRHLGRLEVIGGGSGLREALSRYNAQPYRPA
ncbi:hypothetical protein OOK36_03845 [Streptomyces sp. NBC_00365]|uniref:hypothetical protein n=1 Tax=Streptomyces sp. NBC_00365 TaxID=2975726 RepID=UPI002251B51E|nr:hypothetical protein [Streptomyces sp. NBC_00365]MCX5088033.1 hypothetical protein [Streptomyces sp. NBC_00365]